MANYGRRIRADFYAKPKKSHIHIDGRRRIVHHDKKGVAYIIVKGKRMFI